MIDNARLVDKYYTLLIEKNSAYEGTFFVGVKTTGVLCRPTCPAKKPKKENCEFFNNAQEAILSGYRPCKRCRPLEIPSLLSPKIKELIRVVEENPQKRWKESDFDDLSITSNTARRQFKKYFGMTFIEYARSRRLGLAFNEIRNGKALIDVQLDSGFESGNGFRDAFTRTMGTVPKKNKEIKTLLSKWIETKLGPMIAVADSDALYLLEFVDRRGLEKEIEKLREKGGYILIPGENDVLKKMESELELYFDGKLPFFATPVAQHIGSPFQRKVWAVLKSIPIGQTISYKHLAEKIGDPNASRAVASANGYNQIALIVPCHRVINANGEIGGYGGGTERKKWLLDMEKNMLLK